MFYNKDQSVSLRILFMILSTSAVTMIVFRGGYRDRGQKFWRRRLKSCNQHFYTSITIRFLHLNRTNSED